MLSGALDRRGPTTYSKRRADSCFARARESDRLGSWRDDILRIRRETLEVSGRCRVYVLDFCDMARSFYVQGWSEFGLRHGFGGHRRASQASKFTGMFN